ncbi:hypothetical protein QFZ52_002080 [Arthrobacter woluwensis]|nr:hypothetical protein [Arthrobacter woluwensis]
MPVLVAHGRGHLGILFQDAHRDEQDVLEVDDVAVRLHLFVRLEDTRDGGQLQAARLTAALGAGEVIGRGQHGHLGPLDLRRDVPHRGPVHGEAQPAGRFGDETGLVVQELRDRPADRLGPEILKLPERCRVEGAGLHRGDAEVPQPAAHLRGGTGGERHREQTLRGVDPGMDAVRDAMRDGARLTGPGACQDTQRSGQRGRDRSLFRIQASENPFLEAAAVLHVQGVCSFSHCGT